MFPSCCSTSNILREAYLKVIERAESSNPKFTLQILVKCVRLLRQNLIKYYPADETLLHLDRFAHRMQQQFPEAAPAIEYVRSLLDAISKTRHHKKKDRGQKPSAPKDIIKKPVDAVASAKRVISATDLDPRNKTKRKRPGTLSSGPASSQGLRTRIVEVRRGWLTSNYALARSRLGRAAKLTLAPDAAPTPGAALDVGATISSSLLAHPYFGSHLDGVGADGADVFVIHDEDAIRDRILTVGMSKKKFASRLSLHF